METKVVGLGVAKALLNGVDGAEDNLVDRVDDVVQQCLSWLGLF